MSNLLVEAIQTRDVDRLAALLANGTDPNEIGKSRRGEDVLPLLVALWELEDFSENLLADGSLQDRLNWSSWSFVTAQALSAVT